MEQGEYPTGYKELGQLLRRPGAHVVRNVPRNLQLAQGGQAARVGEREVGSDDQLGAGPTEGQEHLHKPWI